jgi:hypothetical protein
MAQGDPLTVFDSASIATYDQQSNALGWPRMDLLLVNDSDVERLIRQVLAQQKSDYIGVSSMTVDADMDPVHLYGILSAMCSRGIGSTAIFSLHWEHPAGDALDVDLKMIGCHMTMTMEGGQAKLAGEIRTIRNQGPANDAAVWATSTSYAAGQYVTVSGVLYQALSTHTSSSSDEPGSGVNWTTYWQLVT